MYMCVYIYIYIYIYTYIYPGNTYIYIYLFFSVFPTTCEADLSSLPPGWVGNFFLFFFLFFPSHVHLPVTLPIDAVTVLNVFFLFSFSFFLSLATGHAAHGCRDCSYWISFFSFFLFFPFLFHLPVSLPIETPCLFLLKKIYFFFFPLFRCTCRSRCL